ncbi:hypothetical protein OSH03_10735 [Enterobacter sp. E-TC7]|uniref:Uncharacterized protein n=1 Tax=Enterobacter nematophilus TaxID=2994648 RepID=A0ABT3VXZ3_9ENTR|nr:hypothetical protein [Enterobacter nematophilus]MCX5574436.1 hypothetical protein [Enterobacter nematophilus]
MAGTLGMAAAPAEAAPLHPFSLPAMAYQQSQPAKTDRAPAVMHFETHAPITIYAQPGQKPLPVVTITRKDGDGHRFTLADRGAYTGVIASWLHTREPKKKEVTKVKRRRRKKTAKPKEPEAKQGDYLVGTDENVLVLMVHSASSIGCLKPLTFTGISV